MSGRDREFAEVEVLTHRFSGEPVAGAGHQPEIPTMRSCSPSKYSVSTVSSVRHAIRLGGNIKPLPIPSARRQRGQTPASFET